VPAINKKLLDQDIKKNNVKIKNLEDKFIFANNLKEKIKIFKQITNAQDKGKNLNNYKFFQTMYERNSKNFKKKYKTKEPTQKEKDLFIKTQKNILNQQKQILQESQLKMKYRKKDNKTFGETRRPTSKAKRRY
tara:strand:+ start:523 stop:924 length:402 start_codon:yes stop_codon:yes gene_type:complete